MPLPHQPAYAAAAPPHAGAVQQGHLLGPVSYAERFPPASTRLDVVALPSLASRVLLCSRAFHTCNAEWSPCADHSNSRNPPPPLVLFVVDVITTERKHDPDGATPKRGFRLTALVAPSTLFAWAPCLHALYIATRVPYRKQRMSELEDRLKFTQKCGSTDNPQLHAQWRPWLEADLLHSRRWSLLLPQTLCPTHCTASASSQRPLARAGAWLESLELPCGCRRVRPRGGWAGLATNLELWL